MYGNNCTVRFHILLSSLPASSPSSLHGCGDLHRCQKEALHWSLLSSLVLCELWIPSDFSWLTTCGHAPIAHTPVAQLASILITRPPLLSREAWGRMDSTASVSLPPLFAQHCFFTKGEAQKLWLIIFTFAAFIQAAQKKHRGASEWCRSCPSFIFPRKWTEWASWHLCLRRTHRGRKTKTETLWNLMTRWLLNRFFFLKKRVSGECFRFTWLLLVVVVSHASGGSLFKFDNIFLGFLCFLSSSLFYCLR